MDKRAYLGTISLALLLSSIPFAFAQGGFEIAGTDIGDTFANAALAIGIFALIVAIIDGVAIGMLRRRGIKPRKEVHATIIAILVIVFVLSMIQSLAGIELPQFIWTFAFVAILVAAVPAGWDAAQGFALRGT